MPWVASRNPRWLAWHVERRALARRGRVVVSTKAPGCTAPAQPVAQAVRVGVVDGDRPLARLRAAAWCGIRASPRANAADTASRRCSCDLPCSPAASA